MVASNWDISTDYSATANPAGAWSYGRKWTVDATAMDLFTYQWSDTGWNLGNAGNGGPATQAGPILWPKYNGNGLPCIRWTCPKAGQFNIQGRFTGIDFFDYPERLPIFCRSVNRAL